MSKEHPLDAENRRMCEELGAKPCPFCGGTPELFGSDRSGWEVDCAACNATGGGGETKADAIAAWNRRPADPLRDAAPDMLAALKAHVEAEDRCLGPGYAFEELYPQAMQLTRAAIAKAEREQNHG